MRRSENRLARGIEESSPRRWERAEGQTSCSAGRRAGREDAASHRHHHGRQRPLGPPPGAAADRRPPPRRGRRPPHHRRVCPAGHRTAYALLSFQRELEAAGRGNRLPHAVARALHGGRAVADHGAEHPRQRHRPSRGHRRERLAGNGPDRGHERREHGHAALPGHQLRQPGRVGRRLPPHRPARSAAAGFAPTRSAKRRLPPIFTRPACPSRTCSSARPRRCG